MFIFGFNLALTKPCVWAEWSSLSSDFVKIPCVQCKVKWNRAKTCVCMVRKMPHKMTKYRTATDFIIKKDIERDYWSLYSTLSCTKWWCIDKGTLFFLHSSPFFFIIEDMKFREKAATHTAVKWADLSVKLQIHFSSTDLPYAAPSVLFFFLLLDIVHRVPPFRAILVTLNCSKVGRITGENKLPEIW